MNTATLTQGSIVMTKEGLICEYIRPHKVVENYCWVRRDKGYKYSIILSDLHPVPITPELLECFKGVDFISDRGFTFFDAENHFGFWSIKYDEFNKKYTRIEIFNTGEKADTNITLTKFWGVKLHEFQAALKLAEVDFEITLKQLKDYKHE